MSSLCRRATRSSQAARGPAGGSIDRDPASEQECETTQVVTLCRPRLSNVRNGPPKKTQRRGIKGRETNVRLECGVGSRARDRPVLVPLCPPASSTLNARLAIPAPPKAFSPGPRASDLIDFETQGKNTAFLHEAPKLARKVVRISTTTPNRSRPRCRPRAEPRGAVVISISFLPGEGRVPSLSSSRHKVGFGPASRSACVTLARPPREGQDVVGHLWQAHPSTRWFPKEREARREKGGTRGD